MSEGKLKTRGCSSWCLCFPVSNPTSFVHPCLSFHKVIKPIHPFICPLILLQVTTETSYANISIPQTLTGYCLKFSESSQYSLGSAAHLVGFRFPTIVWNTPIGVCVPYWDTLHGVPSFPAVLKKMSCLMSATSFHNLIPGLAPLRGHRWGMMWSTALCFHHKYRNKK